MSKKSSNLKLKIRDQQQIVANAVVRNIDVLKVDASVIALENFILLQNHAKYEAIVFKNKINTECVIAIARLENCFEGEFDFEYSSVRNSVNHVYTYKEFDSVLEYIYWAVVKGRYCYMTDKNKTIIGKYLHAFTLVFISFMSNEKYELDNNLLIKMWGNLETASWIA